MIFYHNNSILWRQALLFILIYPSVLKTWSAIAKYQRGPGILQKQVRRPQKKILKAIGKFGKSLSKGGMTKETSNTTRVTTFRVPLMLFGAAKVKKGGSKYL